jgi:hypothetical protein
LGVSKLAELAAQHERAAQLRNFHLDDSGCGVAHGRAQPPGAPRREQRSPRLGNLTNGAEFLRRDQVIERNGDRAGVENPKKGYYPVRRVLADHQDAVPGLDSASAQRESRPKGGVAQFAIR